MNLKEFLKQLKYQIQAMDLDENGGDVLDRQNVMIKLYEDFVGESIDWEKGDDWGDEEYDVEVDDPDE